MNCKKYSTGKVYKPIPVSTQSDFSDQRFFYVSIDNISIFLFNILRIRKTLLSFLLILPAMANTFIVECKVAFDGTSLKTNWRWTSNFKGIWILAEFGDFYEEITIIFFLLYTNLLAKRKIQYLTNVTGRFHTPVLHAWTLLWLCSVTHFFVFHTYSLLV